MQLKLKLIAAAACIAGSASAFASTPIGTLSPGGSLSYSTAVSGSFLHQLSFDLAANGIDFNGGIMSTFSGAGIIQNFAASLSGPGGYNASWTYAATNTPIKVQTLFDGEAALSAGSYLLTVSGIGQKSDSYTVDMSISAVPEPETYVLMLAGLSAVGFVARRRRSVR